MMNLVIDFNCSQLGTNIKGLLQDSIYRKLLNVSYRNRYNNIEVNKVIEVVKENLHPFENIGFAWTMAFMSVFNILFMSLWAFFLFGYQYFVISVIFLLLQISTVCLANKQRKI